MPPGKPKKRSRSNAGTGAAKRAALRQLQGRREIKTLEGNLTTGFIEKHAEEILAGLEKCNTPIETLNYIQSLKRRELGR